jgi:hypothetical protein
VYGHVCSGAPRNQVVEMAGHTASVHGDFGLHRRFCNLSIIGVMQTTLTIVTVLLATAYVARVFFGRWSRKKDTCGGCKKV